MRRHMSLVSVDQGHVRSKWWRSGPPSQSPGTDALRDLYLCQKCSYAEIASLYGVSKTAVMRWLHTAGISARGTSESTKLGMDRPEIRAKCSDSKRGERHPNWRGGRSDRVTRRSLRTASWERLREACLARDGRACQDCGAVGVRLNAHHLLARREGGEDALSNLITLCCRCHGLRERAEYLQRQGVTG